MISIDEINLIVDRVRKIEYKEERIKKEIKVEVEDINRYSEISSEDFVYIDSSYVHDIIGSYYYIFARAVSVSEKNIEKIVDFIIIPDLFFKVEKGEGEKKKVEEESLAEFASIFSKNLEYKLLMKNKDKIVMLDGSLFSDITESQKYNRIIDNELEKIYEEFRDNLFNSLNYKVTSVAKRILGSSFLNNEDPDVILLSRKFPTEEFYTKIIERDMSNRVKFVNKKLKMIYFRPKYQDHIYRIEAWNNISDEEFYSIVKTTIAKNNRYPAGLKLAHNSCKINNREKRLIEDIIKKEIGYEKTVGWDTK